MNITTNSINGVLRGLIWFDIKDVPKDLYYDLCFKYSYTHPKTEEVFSTFMLKDDRIGVPYGNIDKFRAIFIKHNMRFTVEDRRICPKFDTTIKSKLLLRDYQQTAMDEIMEFIDNGGTEFNLAGKPGSGKSFMLSNLLCILGVKTLIIADKTMLIEQLASEIYNVTGVKPNVLNSKNHKLGDINIATSQFISRNADVWKGIKSTIGCLVIDEAESLASSTVTRIFSRSPAKYKIYISATFSRSTDARTPALIDFAGDKVVVLESTGNIIPSVIMVECPETFTPPMNKSRYAIAKKMFFLSDSIHDKVLKISKYSVSKNRQLLIAMDIGEVREVLKAKLDKEGVSTEIIAATTSTAERARVLEDYNEGKIKAILAFGVLNAGISIPKIQTIVRVSTPSSKEKLEQFIGRGVRNFDGKEGLFVIDLVFNGFNSGIRRTLYSLKSRIEKWKISSTNWESFKNRLGG